MTTTPLTINGNISLVDPIFSYCIYMIFPKLPMCNIAFFADDTTLSCSSYILHAIRNKLQKGLDWTINYFTKWKTIINTTKKLDHL